MYTGRGHQLGLEKDTGGEDISGECIPEGGTNSAYGKILEGRGSGGECIPEGGTSSA